MNKDYVEIIFVLKKTGKEAQSHIGLHLKRKTV